MREMSEPVDPTPTSDELVRGLAGLARDHLLDPPAGADPVIDFASPAELFATFDRSVGLGFAADAAPHPPGAVLAAARSLMDHSVQTRHPRFLNQNFAGPDPVSIVGDWIGAVLNTTGATFEAAPVFTLQEAAVLAKLAHLAGYRAGPEVDAATVDGPTAQIAPGMFCPGGSTATLYALQLARHRLRPAVNQAGADGEKLVIFVSTAGHYSAKKSAALLGLGSDAVVEIITDRDGAMRPKALDRAIAECHVRGETPMAVIATAGTTVTAAFDPIDEIADRCEQHGLWLHVDGCYGGSALFSPGERHRLAGVERSDSFVWNLHKMMGMTQQCSALLVRDPSQLGPCFAVGADYLFQPDKAHSTLDSGDRTFQCARRVDVAKLWLAWKAHGDEGFARRVEHAVGLADHARSAIERSPAFAPVGPSNFTNVVFTWLPPEWRAANADPLSALSDADRSRLHRLAPAIKRRMQSEGTAMVGFQPIDGMNAFRLIFMNPAVEVSDVDAVLAVIERYGEDEWPALA